MMMSVARRLLRLYPGPWRIRYEEEVRHLLDDNPPNIIDVLGLARNAASEWIAEYSDPIARPGLAAGVNWCFRWLGILSAIELAGITGGLFLRRVLGIGPNWAVAAAGIAVSVLCVRGMVNGLTWRQRDGPFRRLGSLELRFWWGAIVLAVVAGHWTDSALVRTTQFWMAGPAMLMTMSERAWHLAKARGVWVEARADHRDTLRRYMHVARLVPKGLATREELEDLGREVNRLNERVRRAAGAYRAAGLRRLPPPLGLNS